VIRLKDGYVSYPTMEGLVWLIPESIGEEHPDENIIIDELNYDNIKVPLTSPAEIPAKHEIVVIHFATPYWGNSANLNMEYKLEGLNKQWTPINANEDHISFSNLASGEY